MLSPADTVGAGADALAPAESPTTCADAAIVGAPAYTLDSATDPATDAAAPAYGALALALALDGIAGMEAPALNDALADAPDDDATGTDSDTAALGEGALAVVDALAATALTVAGVPPAEVSTVKIGRYSAVP